MDSGEWIATERTNPVLWAIAISGPILMVIVGLALAFLFGLVQQAGLGFVAILIAILVVLDILLSIYFLNGWRAKAIRATSETLQIRRMFGASIEVPWGEVSLADVRPAGFGIARWGAPAQRFVGLSPNQYAAVKAGKSRVASRKSPLP